MADTSLDKLMKLSSALPSEDRENGLDHLAERAYDNPNGTLIIGLVVLDTFETKYRPATDQEVAVVRIREIEAVPVDDAPDLYDRLKQMRTARRGPEAEQDTLLDADPGAPLDDDPLDYEPTDDDDPDAADDDRDDAGADVLGFPRSL